MKVAVLGFGAQGKSAYEYWASKGHKITVCDQDENLELPANANKQLGEDHLKNLSQFDLLVRSPIVHPDSIKEANPENPDILSKITTNTNEFFTVCPTKNIIGVTGTKGKGTTSTLISKMLEADGKTVHLGGNIGTPPLELLKNNIQTDDWGVLELANFQLIDLKHSPKLAVCLMVTPEHQDWHVDENEYIEAKQQLFCWQKPDGVAIYYGLNSISNQVASVNPGHKIPYMKHPGAEVIENNIVIDGQTICSVDEIKLLGKHNWQNICAAITAVWQITKNPASLHRVIADFSSLPFRIEPRQERNGVRFYNDSFSTAPDAAIAALEAVPGKKVLILGGFDRGLSLEILANKIKKNESEIQKIILVGNSAARLSEVLESKGFSNYAQESSRDMNAIVRRSLDFAHNGDAVILSPGFASFDMFKNFEERGQAFNNAVESL